MKIRFSTVDEFLAELTKECKSSSGSYVIEDQILRLTYSYRQDPHVPLQYLSVVAGVVIRGKIVELHQYVGQFMSNHESSLGVKAEAAIILAKIDATARELQLEVRAGMFEP
jgi:hypothetical protein